MSDRLTGNKSFLLNLLALALLSTMLPSCGKKSAPKPPEYYAPAQIKNLQAAGTTKSIRLEWQAPDKKANEDDLDDLAQFVIYKRVYDKDDLEGFDDVREVPVPKAVGTNSEETRDNLKKKKGLFPGSQSEGNETPDGIKRDKKPLRFFFEDLGVKPGKQYEYYVVAENEDGVEGRPSETMRVTFVGESSIVERR